ncbi:MAG: HAMP domain-containing sensor histidine kinase, partial [Candidatus Omnitrophota bacterium]|nr:HAMP domain-containing sensor histidine kinase [Candidatus Omnitrophota bacterium]
VNIIKEKQVGRVNAQQQRFLSLADNNLDYIFRSIDRLLEFSHLHSDKAALKKQQVYIAGFIKETVNSFYPLAKDKGVVLKSKGLNKDIKVFIDPDKIRDVLTNLIDNAIRFTPPRGKILVVMAEKHNFIEVSVIDTGAGIPAGVLKKLFTRFYPGNPPKSAQKRSFGLGLAISKSIIEIHGGNIGVASRKGKGSNFTFTLPRN